MKKILLLMAASLAIVASKAQTPIISQMDSVSYAIGVSVGGDLGNQMNEMLDGKQNPQLVIDGMKASLQNINPVITREQSGAIIERYMRVAVEKKQKEAEVKNKENLEKGQKFLAENAKKKGVKALPNGLQYLVVKEGKGVKPSATDTVKVHYEGTLIDGTVFDSSIKRGEPIEFRLDQVIKGWTEGVQLMPTGSTYKLFIPAELGYGSQPAGSIPPNSTLIFEVQLIEVKKTK